MLLTQGWVGYNWQEVFYPDSKPITYQPEKEFTISGSITNAFGKAVDRSGVVLFGNNPMIIKDTLTNKTGDFTFGGVFPTDTAAFYLQARNSHGKSNNVIIKVNEFNPMVFSSNKYAIPWYVNSDTVLINNAHSKIIGLNNAANYRGEGRMLNEVVIKDKKIIKGSKNLNGPGEADYVLDDKDMKAAKQLPLFELLSQRYPSFHKEMQLIGGIFRPNYYLFDHQIHLVIDGLFVERFGLHVDDYINYLTADEIKGIEIMRNIKYASAYDPYFGLALMGKQKTIPIFLEITTYSGNGMFHKSVPGTSIFRPLAFTLSKQFYNPKYNIKNKNAGLGTDMRSTIYWEPNFITDINGKATVVFYSADKPSTYSFIMNGITADGNLGHYRGKINVPLK